VLALLTVANFEPFIGATFAACAPGGGELPAEVVSVRPLREQSGRPNTRPPFALLVRLRTPHDLPQGTFALPLDRLGRLDVFLVPVGRDADGLLLEAVFN
jgi:hypothetical protein